MLFPLGSLRATPGALSALVEAKLPPSEYLMRHGNGDWGDLGTDDCRANDRALMDGDRIFSDYNLPTGVRLWVITEWDRQSTCLLLPSEY